jgi:hypothetical protein
LNISPSFAG